MKNSALNSEISHSRIRSPIGIPTISTEDSDVRNMWQKLQLRKMSQMPHEVAKKNTSRRKKARSADLDSSRTKKDREKRIAAVQI